MRNELFFPIYQAALLALVAHCWFRDWRSSRARGEAQAKLGRGNGSMGKLGATLGFSSVVVLTVNGHALACGAWWAGYSVLVDLIDVSALAYLCVWNLWCRNKIIYLFGQAKLERYRSK